MALSKFTMAGIVKFCPDIMRPFLSKMSKYDSTC
jgi:hypothetical protein